VDFTVENILIPADHPCFEGHFPGHPVFPAVAQIDLLQEIISQQLGRDVIILEIRKAKFPAPILPGTLVHISFKPQHPMVLWQIFEKGKTYSQGCLRIDDNSL
jgi:3-hydroxymyristoyl/3-hydroxydecanoyl-(acyl carrier protein) dehydratase